jgi:hypothetical protein
MIRSNRSPLPGGAWLDRERRHLQRGQPLSERARDALRPMIRPNRRRDSVTQAQIRQEHQHVLRADSPGHHRSQTLSGVLGENLKPPQGPAVVRPIRHEVRRPDVMAVRRPQPEARPLGPPESGSLRLLRGHLEAFFTPNRIHASSPHIPPLASYEIRHRAVAIPPVRFGQCDDPLAQLLSKRIGPWHLSRGGPDLADCPTRPALRHTERGDGMLHGFAPAGRA